MNAKIEIALPLDFTVGKRLQKKLRISVAQAIANRVRHRVQRSGMGARGKLKGYSTNPLLMSMSNQGRLKPIVRPKGRMVKRSTASKPVSKGKKFAFFEHGYRQYREEVGLDASVFHLSNKGELWRDWKAGVDGDTGRAKIGFSRQVNMTAADKAQDDGRPDMFEPSAREMQSAIESAQEIIEKAIVEAIKRGTKKI